MKRFGWVIAALAFGTVFGVAIGLHNDTAIAVLCTALFAVIAIVVFSGTGAPVPVRQRVRVGGGATDDPGSDTEVVARADEPADDDDPTRRALLAGTYITMLIVAADAEGFTLGRTSGIRYLLLGVPVFVLLCGAAITANRGRLAKTTVADRFLLVYGLCGLFGSMFGRAFLHTPYSGTVIFLPMCLGLAHLMVRGSLTAREAARFQGWLVRVGIVFMVFGIISQTPLWPLARPTPTSFERTYFIAWAVSAAWLSRRRDLLALLVVLAGVLFLQYPAATWLVVGAASLATLYATSRRGRRTGTLVMLAFAIGVLGVGFTQVQGGGSSLAKSYFSSVGKTNNTTARTELWKTAEVQIRKSPFFGSLWTGNFTVENRGRAITIFAASAHIEPHNDYLEALILGGLLGLFLFAGLIISTNLVMIRRVHQFSDEGSVQQRDLARVLLVGFNAAFAAAMFNPELSKPGTTAVVFLAYAVMMTLRPKGLQPAGPAERNLTAPRANGNGNGNGHGRAPFDPARAAFPANELFGDEPPALS